LAVAPLQRGNLTHLPRIVIWNIDVNNHANKHDVRIV